MGLELAKQSEHPEIADFAAELERCRGRLEGLKELVFRGELDADKAKAIHNKNIQAVGEKAQKAKLLMKRLKAEKDCMESDIHILHKVLSGEFHARDLKTGIEMFCDYYGMKEKCDKIRSICKERGTGASADIISEVEPSGNERFFIQWDLFGRQTFEITPKFAELMHNTDPKLPAYFLKSPYTCLYIRFPFGWGVISDNKKSRILFLDGVLVYKVNGSIVMHEVYLRIGKDKKPESFTAMLSFAEISEEDKVEDIIENLQRPPQEESQYVSLDSRGKDIARVVLNTILYMNCSDKDMVPLGPERYEAAMQKMRKAAKKKKRDELYQDAQQYTRLTRIIIGSKLAGDLVSHPENAEGMRLTRGFWVRGHFRTYRHERYNEKLREATAVTPQWIKPFWKGPAGVSNRKYVVDVKEGRFGNRGTDRMTFPQNGSKT